MKEAARKKPTKFIQNIHTTDRGRFPRPHIAIITSPSTSEGKPITQSPPALKHSSPRCPPPQPAVPHKTQHKVRPLSSDATLGRTNQDGKRAHRTKKGAKRKRQHFPSGPSWVSLSLFLSPRSSLLLAFAFFFPACILLPFSPFFPLCFVLCRYDVFPYYTQRSCDLSLFFCRSLPSLFRPYEPVRSQSATFPPFPFQPSGAQQGETFQPLSTPRIALTQRFQVSIRVMGKKKSST